MPLQLIPMRVHAPKEVPTAMHIQHDPPPRVTLLLPLVEMRPHLDPLGAHLAAGLAPLPPCPPADPLNAMRTQLRLYGICAGLEMRLEDRDLLSPDPVRGRHPLRGEALDVLDRVVRGVEQELLD
jgi:hypothetical protein